MTGDGPYRVAAIGPALLALALCLSAAGATMESGPVRPPEKDPFKDNYRGYEPDFLELIRTRVGYKQPLRMYPVGREEMRVSAEKSFYTLNTIPTDQRANALVEAALGKEKAERYREAGKIYQMVIDKYPHDMYRVSDYGVYVPVAQYCQRRILGFPRSALEHYRTLHDPAARESFESARAKNSLIGLSEIADTMLATSYGGRAILELGNANLDSGRYLAALEHFNTILRHVPAPELRTPELELKMTYCRKVLGMKRAGPLDRTLDSRLEDDQLERFRELADGAPRKAQAFQSQLASAPYPTADDYVRQAPTGDPLGLTDPVWERTLPGSRRDSRVYVQPTVTRDSVIYRHKNIIYCHSILNGELRWTCDLGGRAVWQHHKERQYPQERVLVQDGLVFTVMHKTGPSLVALDEVTGQLEWAYGPMAASTVREARMRFEAAPAGGPRTVYAGYVLDNIEGEAHTDTEYGLIAFESRTGRIQWQRHLCRLSPGEFAMGFAVSRRNRIRSFSSPPLYHQGTVYYCTNAGAVAALDGLSGRIKWLMRYPYYPRIHDATHPFGLHGRYMNILHLKPWYNQRPLVVGERLYVLPVDTRFMFCLDRGTGKVAWSKIKGVPGTGKNRHRIYDAGACWFLGPISTGELCFVHGQRNGAVQLVDPKTGKVVWRSGDIIKHDDQPVMTLRGYLPRPWGDFEINRQWYRLMARPFLSRDDRLIVPGSAHVGYGWYGTQRGWAHHFCELSLKDRTIVRQRRYYDGSILSMAAYFIYNVCPRHLKNLQETPHKDEKLKAAIRRVKAVTEDHTPRNRYGPFVPFARMTFQRYGTQFELRIGPRSLAMVYDHDAVSRAVQERSDPAARFARAELAIGGGRFDEAADLLKQCLRTASSEDVDFRASIKQQLYQVNKELARIGIRAARPDDELESCLGMARTATTLADEIETWFALAEAYGRKREWPTAGRSLRSIISAYGHRQYPVPATVAAETDRLMTLAEGVFDEAESRVEQTFEDELDRAIGLLRRGLPLYFSTVSPLPKTLTVRAGELASTRLIRLQQRSPEFAESFADTARRELNERPTDEQLHRLWEFPGTPAAQQILTGQFAEADELEGVGRKRRLWRLADAARICHLDIPQKYRPEVTAGERRLGRLPVKTEVDERSHDFADKEGTARLVLERRGDRAAHRDLAFIGGRTRKRLDNKFSLVALDLRTGEVAWDTGSKLRLKGKGQESGFHEAFVLGDLVVVHGLYDVLAFSLDDGSLRWRYRVPFDFEIREAVMSRELLILAGESETIALYIPCKSPAGEVIWQETEAGDLYIPPYFVGDRMISVRKVPFNVTVRYRSTGRLIGRLDIPDLTLETGHPMLDRGHEALPVAHHGDLLIVSDSWYYIALDTDRLTVRWKRLIDNNDASREPAMRFALKPPHLFVVKEDYDQKVAYMLSSETGEILWRTDPKEPGLHPPMYSAFIEGGRVHGLMKHPGQGFYFAALDCKSGDLLFKQEVAGYQDKPDVTLVPHRFGPHVVARMADRQEFEIRAFDAGTGKPLARLKQKGVGPFGVHGRVSAAVQAGRLVLLTKDKLAF